MNERGVIPNEDPGGNRRAAQHPPLEPDPLPDETLGAILKAATQSPSPKNRQPWRNVVVQGQQRSEMLRRLRQGIAKRQAQGEGTGSSESSARIMEQAPVTVFVFNPNGTAP